MGGDVGTSGKMKLVTWVVVAFTWLLPGCVSERNSIRFRDLRLAAITSTASGGYRVGLVETNAQPWNVYFLSEGDVTNGIGVMRIDFDSERVLLRQGAKTYWIHMDPRKPDEAE